MIEGELHRALARDVPRELGGERRHPRRGGVEANVLGKRRKVHQVHPLPVGRHPVGKGFHRGGGRVLNEASQRRQLRPHLRGTARKVLSHIRRGRQVRTHGSPLCCSSLCGIQIAPFRRRTESRSCPPPLIAPQHGASRSLLIHLPVRDSTSRCGSVRSTVAGGRWLVAGMFGLATCGVILPRTQASWRAGRDESLPARSRRE